MTTVLVADDQRDVRDALALLLEGEGFSVVTADNPAAAYAVVERQRIDVALVDLNYARDTTSGKEGLSLLASLQKLDATLPVVVMTAWGSVDVAVAAMRAGARDYVQKPWENERLVHTLRTQVELKRSQGAEKRLRGAFQPPTMIAHSPAMRPVLQLLEKVADSDANVLITGEHGTGKEVIARSLHAGSKREAFVAVNAGGLSDGVFESELFGHVKGAFTDAKNDRVGCFEMADHGTLFLDEIGNMPLGQQAKLLRVLQTGEFHPVGSSKLRHADVRVLSATNADLSGFRQDLLYRLNTVEIRLPPLRERPEDVLPLAEFFLRGRKRLSETAKAQLQRHAWPGNVRELSHVVERALLMASGEIIEDVALRSRGAPPRLDEMTLEEVERVFIEKALQKHGNATDAAKALGLSRSAMYRRMQDYGIK